KAAAHDADADTSPRGNQADHQPDTDTGVGLDHRQHLKFLHCGFSLLVRVEVQWCSCAIAIYTTVSIMKMYACSRTIRMWKIAQPSPSQKPKKTPASPVAAHIQRRRNRISPA